MSEDNGHQASTAGINPLDGEIVLENVHPSWINWKGRLFSSLLFFVVGLGVDGGGRVMVMGLGVLLFLNVYFSRKRSRYIVTNQRIKGKTGLIGSSTFETRLGNINGISTNSGIIEGLFGKGAVQITDAAGERLTMSGIGNYEELARSLREQHQQSMQPGRGGHGATARPGSAAGQQRGGQRTQQQEQQTPGNGGTEPQSDSQSATEQTETETIEKDRCLECGTRVDADVSFCPECGADDPFTPSKTDEAAASTRSESAPDPEPEPEPEPRDHPITAIADSIANRHRPDSSAAADLCQALAAEDIDERRLEDALEAAVETLETTAAVTDAVEGVDDPSERRQLESAQRALAGERGRLPDALEPIVDRTIAVGDELDACERDRDRMQEAADAACRAASQNADVRLRSDDVADRTAQLAETIESGELGDDTPESTVPSVASDLERSARPQSPQARELLETLGEPASDDTASVLQSTVDSLDAYADLQASIADIGERDVRRRLDALDEELQRADGDIYRHLADRVRELEAMLERDGVTDVQLYAIYQECTFYDRTLLPRLSRSLDGDTAADTGQLIADLEARIDEIEREYIDVRADHNHTIPRHFLSLADDLRAEAQRVDGESPMRAVGLCSAADEVLGHVEALYERNEYSVMLRRLRG